MTFTRRERVFRSPRASCASSARISQNPHHGERPSSPSGSWVLSGSGDSDSSVPRPLRALGRGGGRLRPPGASLLSLCSDTMLALAACVAGRGATAHVPLGARMDRERFSAPGPFVLPGRGFPLNRTLMVAPPGLALFGTGPSPSGPECWPARGSRTLVSPRLPEFLGGGGGAGGQPDPAPIKRR